MSKPISERAMAQSVAVEETPRRKAYTASGPADLSSKTSRFLFASQHAQTNNLRMRPITYRTRRRIATAVRIAIAIAALAALATRYA